MLNSIRTSFQIKSKKNKCNWSVIWLIALCSQLLHVDSQGADLKKKSSDRHEISSLLVLSMGPTFPTMQLFSVSLDNNELATLLQKHGMRFFSEWSIYCVGIKLLQARWQAQQSVSVQVSPSNYSRGANKYQQCHPLSEDQRAVKTRWWKSILLRHLSLPVHLALALKAAEVLLFGRLLGLHERLLDKAADVLFCSSPTHSVEDGHLFMLSSVRSFPSSFSFLPQHSSSHNLTDWRVDHSLLCACF